MANTIKLKQGSGSNPSASDLVVGEVALRTDGNPKLFTKNDAGNVLEVGLDSLNDKLPLAGGTLTGNLTLSSVTPQLYFTDTNHDPDFAIWNHNGTLRFLDTTNSNATRLEIQAGGLVKASNSFEVTGTCTATTFSGSGASLTNIPAGQLTGTLPALDGSNLTGLTVNNASTLDNLDSTQFLRSDTNTLLNGIFTVGGSSVSGNEGGEIRFTHSPNSSLGGNEIVLDVVNSNFRIFEGGGNTRGFYLDLTSASNSAAGKIFHDGNDGSGSGLDSDTVDGIQASSFLRSDATDTLTGNEYTFSSSANQKIILSGSTDPYIRFKEGTTNKAYIQWNSSGYLDLVNQEDSSLIRIRDNITFSPDGGTSNYKIWNSGNDGTGSGLDSDTVDGIQASSFLRSDANDTAAGNLTLTSNSQYPLNINGTHDGKIVVQGSSNPYIRFREGTTDKAYLQWHSGGHIFLWNSEATRGIRLGSILEFYNGSGYRTVFHTANDGSGSGLDSDTLDGVQGSSYLRSDTDDTFGANLTVDNGSSTLLRVKCDNDGNAVIRAGGEGQGTGAVEVVQQDTYGGGISYNGDGSPSYVSGETADHITFYRIDNGTRTEVFHYPYNSNTVNFNARPTIGGVGIVKSDDTIAQATNASTLDTLDSSQFLRSDTDDVATNYIVFSDDKGIRLSHTNQQDSNDGVISAGRFGSGLNIVGTQTTGGLGRQVRIWGDVLTNAGSKFFNAGNDGAGSGLDSDLLDGQQGSYYTNAGNLSSGTIPAARIGSASTAELGISVTGNFGQWQPHSQYTDFNSEPAYWGWNYVMGNTNAPNTTSSQWYRGRFSLGDAYGKGSDAGDYSMEITVPRSNPFTSGSMYVRTIENGNEGSWAEVGTRPYNSILPIQTSVALGNTTSRFANVYSQELNITKASGNLSAIIQADSGLGTIEVGGSTGAFIDLKHPATDDFDLRIGANANNGYIDTVGNFHIACNSKNALYATADNTTELFYNGSHRLSTRDAGCDLHKAGEYFLKLTNTSNGQSDGTYVSSLIGMGKDDANNYTEYTKMITQIVDASNGTEDGRLIMQSMKDGTMTTAATVEAGYFQRNNAPGVSGDNFNWSNSNKYMHSGGLRFNTGDWNNSTGTFTCPVTGHYLCMATVQGHRNNDNTGSSDQYFNVLWQKNNVNQFSESVATQHPNGQSTGNTTATHYTVSQCVIIQCSTGDTLRAHSNHGYRNGVQNQLSIMLLA